MGLGFGRWVGSFFKPPQKIEKKIDNGYFTSIKILLTRRSPGVYLVLCEYEAYGLATTRGAALRCKECLRSRKSRSMKVLIYVHSPRKTSSILALA